jgi:hypothetical protein
VGDATDVTVALAVRVAVFVPDAVGVGDPWDGEPLPVGVAEAVAVRLADAVAVEVKDGVALAKALVDAVAVGAHCVSQDTSCASRHDGKNSSTAPSRFVSMPTFPPAV